MPIELAPKVYWVGAIDWTIRDFHGYLTEDGSTYNAYLIVDDHITLIDTVKKEFVPEMLARVAEIVDPGKIDYIVSNHVEKISVKIPPGTLPGKKLRLSGKGQPSPMGGPAGDLYVKLKEVEHPVFKREGNDLYVDRKIRFTEATLGTKVTVPTLDGKTMSLKVPAGTQSHTKMRLKNYGLPMANGKTRGDQYVRIIVETPANLTKKQKTLLEELTKEGL